MSEYVSRKSDASSLIKMQPLKPDTWVTLEVEGKKSITPNGNSKAGATWAYYLNIETPKIGGATEIIIKFVRNPLTKPDETGRMTFSLKKGGTTWINHMWMFQAVKAQSVAVQMMVNGKATIKTREIKMGYEVGK